MQKYKQKNEESLCSTCVELHINTMCVGQNRKQNCLSWVNPALGEVDFSFTLNYKLTCALACTSSKCVLHLALPSPGSTLPYRAQRVNISSITALDTVADWILICHL